MHITDHTLSIGECNADWWERFNFFEIYGAPNAPRSETALNLRPGFKNKLPLTANITAFSSARISCSCCLFSALEAEVPAALAAGLNVVLP